MEKGQGEYRLPCGVQGSLLQRPLCPCARGGGATLYGWDGRGLLQGQTGRQPPKERPSRPAYDTKGTYAQESSRVSGVEADQAYQLGEKNRGVHRDGGGGHHKHQEPPGAG